MWATAFFDEQRLDGSEMTKRVKVSAVAGVRLNERELAILKRIADGDGTHVLSINGLARDFLCSEGTIRNSIHSLEGKELVSVRARYLRNGGQLENEYELTSEGERVVKVDSELD